MSDWWRAKAHTGMNPMTPLDLNTLDKQHSCQTRTPDGIVCDYCGEPWPCTTSTLIARVRELEAQVADWRETLMLYENLRRRR